MTIAIYLAHLNPVTNAHSEIIKELTKEDDAIGASFDAEIERANLNDRSGLDDALDF